MRKVIIATTSLALGVLSYACNSDDDEDVILPPVTSTPVQLTATLINQGTSTSATSGSSTATASFSGVVNQSSSTSGTSGTTGAANTNTLSYTITYAGITPTAITLDPVSSSATSGSSTTGNNTGNSILLAGSLSTGITDPGSGTATSPGSGTSTSPGSGTSTTPGSGTSTTPGSGTSTTPGSGTSTTPGSGTSTSPGSGTATTLISPLISTINITQSRADSLRNGLYNITIRSATYPNGEFRGNIRTQ